MPEPQRSPVPEPPRSGLPGLTEQQVLQDASPRVVAMAGDVKEAVFDYRRDLAAWQKSGSKGDTPKLSIPKPGDGRPWDGDERASVQLLINLYAKLPLPKPAARQAVTKSPEDLAMEILTGSSSVDDTGPQQVFKSETLSDADGVKAVQAPGKKDEPKVTDSSTAAKLALQKYMRRPR